jgi:hypothetical protein
MGAFRGYGIEIRPGVGFTQAFQQPEKIETVRKSVSKERTNFNKELRDLQKRAGL